MERTHLRRTVSKGRWSVLLACALAGGAQAGTYWLNAATGGAKPPACFRFYSDEACTQEAAVTPTEDDGNVYVVLGASKMTSAYTAPRGTAWVFGADGVRVGTQKALPDFYTNGGIALDFSGGGVATNYGLKCKVNSAGTLLWKGAHAFVDAGQTFTFSVDNAESAVPRGIALAGTFHADESVVVTLTRAGGQAGSTSYMDLTGDFSAFRGRFLAKNTDADRTFFLRLTSASAFGAPDAARADALTLAGFVRWSVAAAVRQDAAKGVTLDLTETQTSELYAAEGEDWTLTAPLAGKTGTLAKGGPGRVTLAGPLEITQLVVNEGTLVVDAAAAFAPGTTLEIRPGAQVVSRQGLAIPNVTVVRAEGAGFSFDFTTPFADGQAATLDQSALAAADWAALVKPVPVQLSQAIPLPLDETNRYALVRFPASLGVKAADFRDTTPKTSGLPTTWIEVVPDGEGGDVVTLVARPAVRLAAARAALGFTPSLLEAVQTTDAGETPATWSDGRAPHAGADYLVDNGSPTVTGPGWAGRGSLFVFPGESLTYANGSFWSKHETNRFARLVVCEGVTCFAMGTSAGDNWHVLEGALELPSGKVSFQGTGDAGYRAQFELAATVTGQAALAFTGDSKGLPARFSGDGTGFGGTVRLEMTGTQDVHAGLECANPFALVADRAVADPRALYVANAYNDLRVTEDATLANDVLYGLALGGSWSALSVAAGRTLTLDGRLRLQSLNAEKRGEGVLALGGQILYSCDGGSTPKDSYVLHVREGWVKPHAWRNGASYSQLCLKLYDAAAGIACEPAPADAHVARYGLCLERDDAVSFADDTAKLGVRLLLPEAGAALRRSVVCPVLTVPDALAPSLAGRFAVVKDDANSRATVTAAPAEGKAGFTTFTVTREPLGLTVILR